MIILPFSIKVSAGGLAMQKSSGTGKLGLTSTLQFLSELGM